MPTRLSISNMPPLPDKIDKEFGSIPRLGRICCLKNMGNQTAVGLDLSLTHTGMCVINDSCAYGRLIIPKKLHGIERIFYIERELKRFFREVVCDIGFIDAVCIEGYSFGSRGKVFDIAEMGGVIKYWLCTQFLELNKYEHCFIGIVAPTTLKKFITGKGSGKKELILKEMYRRFDLDLTDNNIADAAGLAIMAYAKNTWDACNWMIKPQAESLGKVQDLLADIKIKV